VSWLSLGIALIGFARAIFTAIESRNTADAATAKLILQGLRAIDERMAKADAARASAQSDFDARGLPGDDPNLRD
jgi:hypothetical protein